ncbi:MAG: DegV family protein, partial [Halanaerobiaceae bacterium]|nr:DegV family protein [Halanaerobiaceae bacterium]
DKYGELPKTSAPTPADYDEFFRSYIEQGYELIYFCLSSHFSSGYQNACLAAKNFPEGQVEVVDSRNLSTGIGLLVMKAVDYLNEGKDKTYIINKLNEIIPKVKTRFIIDNLDFLYKGGRCTSLQRFLGSMLKFKIEIKVADGKMDVASHVRGSKEKALNKLLKNVETDLDNIDTSRIFITHSMEDKGAEYLSEQLKNKIGLENVIVANAGNVISSHCGPGTIGVLYITTN